MVAHNLDSEFFTGNVSEITATKLGDYFPRQINLTLINPYTIYFENVRIREPYKFVAGSFERLKEVLSWRVLAKD